jgi:hypothetical protein
VGKYPATLRCLSVSMRNGVEFYLRISSICGHTYGFSSQACLHGILYYSLPPLNQPWTPVIRAHLLAVNFTPHLRF